MKTLTIHRAESRGLADHGWLKSYHTFSFANYYHPDRMQFGALRVLNDEMVAGGEGFGNHPHENMEIISIPLEGSIHQTDNLGNTGIIPQGAVQVMSAGTGISHSEFNNSKDAAVKFLEIWLFPKIRNTAPRYDHIHINESDRKNQFRKIISPYSHKEGAWVYQDAWFYMSKMDAGLHLDYKLNQSDSGVYAFVLNGSLKVNKQLIHSRDGIGITGHSVVSFEAVNDSEVLLMEIPMNMNIAS